MIKKTRSSLKRRGPVLLVAGTRPEVIKLALLHKELCSKTIPTQFCAIGQHAELLDQAFRCFGVQPDIRRHIMKPKQDLFHTSSRALLEAKKIFSKVKPSLVVVQGDTTTAAMSALAAFYLNIPVVHVEAGLRTPSIHRPFPEELNRRLITQLAQVHFAPTPKCVERLCSEGVLRNSIFYTGNTVVDALLWIRRRIASGAIPIDSTLLKTIEKQKKLNRKILLLTAHRRESFGDSLVSIFRAMGKALEEHNHLFILFPVHPNPAIQEALHKSKLAFAANLLVLPPLAYPDLVFALDSADIVATDSGGIQEEAASLNKHILILRTETDRPEASSCLVGASEEKIMDAIRCMMQAPPSKDVYMPYGDGTASQNIALVIQELWEHLA